MTRIALRAAPAAALVLCLAPAAAAQVPDDPLLSGFRPSGDWVLELDGKPAPKAEIYKSARSAAILVMSPQLPSPVLVNPGAGSVVTVSFMKIAKKPDGSLALLADAALEPQGVYRPEGEAIAFRADGHDLKLAPKPWLLKARSAAELFAHNPVYGRHAEAYAPDGAALRALRGQKKPVRVQVFFGSWCPHCTQYLPRLLKVEQALGTAAPVKFDYYGLPRGREMTADPEAKRYGVDSVPIGIVFVGGREVGRLAGNGWFAPERSLQDLLEVSASVAR